METDFPPSLDELVQTFDELEDWDERYEYLIELGRELPPLAPDLQTETNRVHGCLSTVWLSTTVTDAQTIDIVADSDSIIVKGLIVVLLSVFSGRTAREILDSDVNGLFTQLGLNQHLSSSRRNGLHSMVNRVRQHAAESLIG